MVKETLQRARFFFRTFRVRNLDVLDQLEMDHVRVEMLFLRWRFAMGKKRRQEIFNMINKEWSFHNYLEESLFYPACENIEGLKDLAIRSVGESQNIKNLIKEIADTPGGGSRAVAKVRTVMDLVNQHVAEEENELFPRVRELMKKSQLDRLGKDLRYAREQITEKLAA